MFELMIILQLISVKEPSLNVGGMNILDRKCTKKHIRRGLQSHNTFRPNSGIHS